MVSRTRADRSWLAIALFSILAVAPVARAQQQNQAKPSNFTTVQTNAQPPSDIKNSAREANSAPQQQQKADSAGSGDAEAQFKNSASLRWTARKLGVSTATAYELSVVLNFLVIIVGTVLILRSKLPALFRNRTQVIRQALDEARKASAEAQRRLAAIEARLAKAQSEIAAMQAAAEKESRAEEERIRAAAEEEKSRIVQAAEQEIAAAVTLAKRDFRGYAADLAVTLAANSIQVDASTDGALLRAFVAELEPTRRN